MSKIESSIARMHHLQSIPVHYDMGDRTETTLTATDASNLTAHQR
uniref:Uncharacterized protein n=1 Tax=Siphoviridae sp. ct3Md4 TaxID=2826282 RepID=A0A8S5NJV6_9CAUD|nr:MAG TPA: hypothetical protein [Siphoviridae sp. ct3Md4]